VAEVVNIMQIVFIFVVNSVRCVLYLCRMTFQRYPLKQNIDKHPVSELTQTSGLLPLLFTLLYNPQLLPSVLFPPFCFQFSSALYANVVSL